LINPSRQTAQQERAQARKSALLVGGVFLLLAAWSFYRGRVIPPAVMGGVGASLILIGLLLPALAVRFHVLWMRLAMLLGWVNSRVLLSALYYTAFTAYGIVSKLFSRDPLNRRSAKKDSYWIPRPGTRQPKERFERLF